MFLITFTLSILFNSFNLISRLSKYWYIYS